MKRAAAGFAAALLLFGFYLAFRYFSAAAGPGLLAAALLFLIVLICTGTGRLVLRMFRVPDLSESDRTLIGCTLGVGLLSQGMFALGMLGGLRPWATVLLLSGFWVIGFTEMPDVLRSLGANRNLLRDRPAWTTAILALAALAFWTSWVPPHQYDSLVYHLALPDAYIRHGGIVPVESLIYSFFPQNGEMLFALGLLLGSDLLAQMFSWLAFFLSLLWVFEMGKREMPLTAALLACLLAATHTAVLLLAGIAYVETLAMLWITASVLCFCRWREIAGGGSGRGWLALSAVFAGFGVGTKYYAGVCPAALGTWLAARWLWGNRVAPWAAAAFGRERSGRPAVSTADLVLFCALSIVVSAPWLVRNALVLGNPVFPFLMGRLPYHGPAWAAAGVPRYFQVLGEYGHPGAFFKDLLLFPYLAATGSPRFGGGMDVLGNWGWGLLLALVPAAAAAARKNKTLFWILIYCGAHWAVWFYTGVVLRFLAVVVPLLCLPAAAGLYRWGNFMGARGRGVLISAAVLCMAVNLGFFLYVHTILSSWGVLLGADTREEFLARKLDYYPCARYAREHLAKNDKILVVGDARGYYIAQDHVAAAPMAAQRLGEWANRAQDASDFAGLLKEEGGFSHLLVVPRELKRLGGSGAFSLTERGYRNWTGLESGRLKEVFAPGSCALLEIL